MNSALLADLIAAVHLSIVAFIVGGQLLVVIGWPLGFQWIRNAWFRFTHLAIMLYIVQNAVRGELCFLTHWEWDLREKAGQTGEEGSFIGSAEANTVGLGAGTGNACDRAAAPRVTWM